MLSCSIRFSAPSFWMGGGLESRCLGRVCGADGAVHSTIRTVHTTYTAALKTTTHPKTRCRKPYAATQHLMLLMMGVCTRNMCEPSAPYTRSTQRLSRPPPIQKLGAATQHLMLLMMGVCTRNMSSWEYTNKITFLHQVGISLYFITGEIQLKTVRCLRGVRGCGNWKYL